MALPIEIPEHQFCDADGEPYAGGTLGTYVPGTSTPKETWSDTGGTALNTNPVILDAAGRCLLFGDGDYRLILHDAAGNLIWDIWATTIVSAAMQPVVSAPTIADAQHLLGIQDWSVEINAETSRAEAAEASLHTQITNEVARAEASESTLTTNLNNEIARAEAAETNLQNEINALETSSTSGGTIRAGSTTADSSGNIHVVFSPAFPNGVADARLGTWDSLTWPIAPPPQIGWVTLSLNIYGWVAQIVQSDGTPIPLAVTNWWAIGW